MNARAKTRQRAGKMGKASEDYKVTALSFRFVRPLKGQVRPFPSPKWTQTPQQLQCTGSAVTILQTCLLKRRVGLGGRGTVGTEARQLDKGMEIF